MNDTRSITIPALPCPSLDEALLFWQALGFQVTYKQRAPNAYAVIHDDDYDLHLFGLKDLKPHENFSTCLVIVAEVEQLHHTFAERLRTHLGKLPITGFPRIARMKPGQSRFTLTDIAGNSVIFIKRGDEDAAAADAYKQPDQTPLQRAINTAARLRDFKGDDAAAARVLDAALRRKIVDTAFDRARATAARIELALAMDDLDRARMLRADLKQMPLSEDERQRLRHEQPTIDLFEPSHLEDNDPTT